MRSPTTISGNAYATLLIFGAIALAVFIFFIDQGTGTQETPSKPTETTADLEQFAQHIQTNLAQGAPRALRDQAENQLANIQSQLPSLAEFVQGDQETAGLPSLQAMPTAIPEMPTMIVLPTMPPMATPLPPPTWTPLPPPPPAPAVTIPVQQVTEPPLAVLQARKINSIPHIMTPQGLMNCQDIYGYYGDNVDINGNSPFTSWFRGLPMEERKAYFGICDYSWKYG